MKKKILKGLFGVFALTFCLSTCMTVLALGSASVSKSQDGIEATLSFDKEEYEKGDLVEVTLNIENNNSYIISDIETELVVPESMKLEKGSLKQDKFSLNGEENKEQELTFKVDSEVDDEVIENPSTNDNIGIYVGVMIASLIALIVIAVVGKYFHAKGLITFGLAFVVVGSLTIGTLAKASSITKEFSFEKTIKYDGKELLIKGIVKYSEAEEFTIEVVSGENGTASPSGEVLVKRGEDQEIKIIPNDGYRIEKIEVDGISKDINGTYTFVDVRENHKIEVIFERIDVCVDPNCVSCPEKSGVCTECAENYELNSVGFCEIKCYTEDCELDED